MYLNLAEGLLWVQDVEGSNPFTPTTFDGSTLARIELSPLVSWARRPLFHDGAVRYS